MTIRKGLELPKAGNSISHRIWKTGLYKRNRASLGVSAIRCLRSSSALASSASCRSSSSLSRRSSVRWRSLSMRRSRSSFSLSLCFLSASSSSALASALACMAASAPAPLAAVAMVRPLAAASLSAASILALAIRASLARSTLFFCLISFSCNPSAIPSSRLRCVVTSQPGGRRTPRGGAFRAAIARASCSCLLAARRVRAERMASSSSASRSSPIFLPGRFGSLPPACSMSFSVV
mmetsp:Transcript_8194/g.19378  ORF Transcript_8194/g.19378 Transcript_8194/m.19378 type:complete len:236 (+) Transcript_8194:298-1005(+)